PERLEEPPEFRPGLLVAHAHRTEDALLDLLTVDPDRARAELPAVPDQVVMLAERRRRVGLDQALVPVERTRERMVDEGPLTGVLVLLEEREVEHPQELVPGGIDEAELLAQLQAQGAEHPFHHPRRSGGEQDGGPGGRAKCLELPLGEELRDRGAELA